MILFNLGEPEPHCRFLEQIDHQIMDKYHASSRVNSLDECRDLCHSDDFCACASLLEAEIPGQFFCRRHRTCMNREPGGIAVLQKECFRGKKIRQNC